MLNFKFCKNPKTNEEWIETSLMGKPLLTIPQLNKGTAFSIEERHTFGLMGKLPIRVEELQEQAMRAYLQFKSYDTLIQKNIYLNNLHNTNEVLFYELIQHHIEEMLPVIYTPIVGTAVIEFSQQFRHPRGIYISYPDIDRIDEILNNRTNPDIDLIVVSDGEGVLGIGDQGVGAMDIPIAKLMVYTIVGRINPYHTLPILLDVGTNNQVLLDDPLYLGWRHPRINGQDYDDFIDKFIVAVKKKFPNIYLHWEDFGRKNARRNLDRFRDQICTFNDDIQGTGVVTLAALLAAIKATQSSLKDQRVVIFGAGTAGVGIADQISAAMQKEGLSESEAVSRFWLLDRSGLLTENSNNATPEQKVYRRKVQDVQDWQIPQPNYIDLDTVIKNVKPTILIGCSAAANSFNQESIKDMYENTKRPIIFPLSNPTEKSEAHPAALLDWTEGQALIATGSPFPPVNYKGKQIVIGQCNNALVYPGIGLGVLAVKAKRLTDNMLWAACERTAELSPILSDPSGPLLPTFDQAQQLSREIAIAVANQAIKDGVADQPSDQSIEDAIDEIIWEPHYVAYKKVD